MNLPETTRGGCCRREGPHVCHEGSVGLGLREASESTLVGGHRLHTVGVKPGLGG